MLVLLNGTPSLKVFAYKIVPNVEGLLPSRGHVLKRQNVIFCM